MIGVNARRETNYTRDEQLLRRYVQTGSDQAFAEIVGEYMPLVYAACLRELPDSSQAQDAAQVVFIVLACRAGSIRNGRALASWLFRTACLTARDMLKRERRRQALEQQLTTEALHGDAVPGEWDRALWNRLEPALDDALLSLGSADRECVLLHYIVGYNLREIGALLQISEDAARKRTARALEKMRRFMNRKDAAIAPAVLAGLLAGYRANAQPLLPDLLKNADLVAVHAVGRAAGPPQLTLHAQGVLTIYLKTIEW